MGDHMRILLVVITSFSFFSSSFSKVSLRTAVLPSWGNVVSSIYQLFVPRFAMAVFVCIYFNYRINKRRDMSFEFSSVLSTVDISKYFIITAWIIQKFIPLVSFVTFSVFFFSLDNRTCMSGHFREMSYFLNHFQTPRDSRVDIHPRVECVSDECVTSDSHQI